MASPDAPDPQTLLGVWRIDAIDGRPALAGVEATVELHDDGRVAGTAGVNRFMGTWSITGKVLAFGPLATTLMAGPPDRMEQEGRVVQILGSPLEATAGRATLVLEGDGRLELTRIATRATDADGS